jgi:hypothetical protein
MRKVVKPADDPSGLLEVDSTTGQHYWMGSRISACEACGVVVTNVDDCGHFGDPACPTFGRGVDPDEEPRKLKA